MTAVLSPAFTCPPWCDSTCQTDEWDEWRRLHTQNDESIPAALGSYATTKPTKVLFSLVRQDFPDQLGAAEVSLAVDGGFDDVRLSASQARLLAVKLNELAALAEAS